MYDPYLHFFVALAGTAALTAFVWGFIEGVIQSRGERKRGERQKP